MPTRFLFAAFACAAGALPAQTLTPVQKTVPEVLTGVFAPGVNVLPLGRTRGLIQTWYAGSQVPKAAKVWREIGWRMDEKSFLKSAQTHKLEVVLGNTKADFKSLNTTFAANLGTSTVFFSLKTVSFPVFTGWTKPDQPSLYLKGDRPFVYTGPNLIVQVKIRTGSGFSTILKNYADALTMGSGDTFLASTRTSCGGTLKAEFDTTQKLWKLLVSGAKANSLFLVMIGQHLLPVDVGPVFGKGCSFAVDPVFILPLTTNASGAASFSAAVPSGTTGLALFAQGFHPAKSRTGFETTNLTHSLLSDAGLVNYLYNWSVDGPQAQYGPYPTNRGAVLLIR